MFFVKKVDWVNNKLTIKKIGKISQINKKRNDKVETATEAKNWGKRKRLRDCFAINLASKFESWTKTTNIIPKFNLLKTDFRRDRKLMEIGVPRPTKVVNDFQSLASSTRELFKTLEEQTIPVMFVLIQSLEREYFP